MEKSDLSIVILAAGKGTRMKSALPKVLHKIAGREMVNLTIDTAKLLKPNNISVVISEDIADFADRIIAEHPTSKINFALQKERLGTAHAVKVGINALPKIGKTVLILYADTPLLKVETLQEMVTKIQNKNSSVCVLGFDCADESNKYGRLVVNKNHLDKIVEYKDANQKERKIKLCNSGVIAVAGDKLKLLLAKVNNKNASGEYYLTDIIGLAKKAKLKCGYIKASESEVMGVNSRNDLSAAEIIKQNRLRSKLMENGVTMLDPASVYLSFDTEIENDVVIHPHVVFGVGVKVDSNVEIKSFCHLEGAIIKSGAIVGPFARIRPGTSVGNNARIGNFVEIKKSNIAKGAKINHLSYVGDSEVGAGANIGAGTITCNYDGYNKFKTKIGKGAFIGSNTALIAPVIIGDNAVIGAGSVISKDVADNDLAVSRAKQIEIKDGGAKYHKYKSDKKKPT
jgi:bifunctional UDP-N-acetylglucosamine pyrophosphorylase/glucosamine-1-phosphate N-acetyltransferase